MNPLPHDWTELPLVLTTEQAAELLQLHVNSVKALCRGGRLPAAKVGNVWRIKRADLMTLVSASPRGSLANRESAFSSGDLSEETDLRPAVEENRRSPHPSPAEILPGGPLPAFLDLLSVAVVVTDATGSVTLANRAANELMGERVTGGSLAQASEHPAFCHPDGSPKAPGELPFPAALRGVTSRDVEILINRADGRHISVLVSAGPLCGPSGSIIGAIATMQDVTELAEARQRESAARERLRLQSERLQILHDIETAILAVRSPAEIAQSAAAGVRSATSATRVSVLVWSEDETAFDVLAVDGFVNPKAAAGMRLPMQAYQGYAANQRGETSIVEDMAMLPNPTPSMAEAVTQGIRSNAGIPLVAGGRTLGALLIARAGTGRLSDDMLDLARHVADSLAVAIQNARLFEEVRRGETALQELSRRLVQVQEAERRSLSRDLHDTSSQTMTALKLGLGLLNREGGCSPAVRAEIEKLSEMAEAVSEELHRLAVNLRPYSLDRYGLVPALRQLIDTLQVQSNLKISFLARGLEGERLPGDVETALYRIVQESLTNVVRHAHADSVSVLAQRNGDHIRLIVEDDGIGFDAQRALGRGRLGLLGMRERAEMLGGALTIESRPRGLPSSGAETPRSVATTLYVEIPLLTSAIDS